MILESKLVRVILVLVILSSSCLLFATDTFPRSNRGMEHDFATNAVSSYSNFTTYFGTSGNDTSTIVKTDGNGNTILVGHTDSNELPTTPV